ncbi:MAG: DUF58 domain-containing protein [Planctomycetes bacterium]|nr:DUF58 domain-containing protein [Planctomycetota bacterium]
MLLTPPELSRLHALAAARRSAAPGAPGGGRPGPRKGEGSDFTGHRPYVAGDDPRNIDWNAYVRTGGLHVMEFREEVEGSLAVLLDLSSSMTPGGKDVQSRRIAAAAAVVALFLGDRARIAAFAGGRSVEPRGFATAHEIPDLDRWLESLDAGGGAAGLAAAKTLLAARRGRVLFVSDLMEDPGPGAALVALRERGHGVTVAHVLSREEAAPPHGLMHLRDAETGETREVLVDAAAATCYAAALDGFCHGWQTLCASHGMKYARVLADQPLSDWADSVC